MDTLTLLIYFDIRKIMFFICKMDDVLHKYVVLPAVLFEKNHSYENKEKDCQTFQAYLIGEIHIYVISIVIDLVTR